MGCLRGRRPSEAVSGTKAPRWAGLVVGLLLGAGLPAQAQPLADADAAYEQERAACFLLSELQRQPCLREAAAAAQASRTGALAPDADAAHTYMRNARARCAVFTDPQDRADCLDRLGSTAEVQGSVEGGGLLRRTERTYVIGQ